MAYFKRKTSETNEKGKQNAVIMGRKTWDSIPEKFRPLQNRVNVVLSRTLEQGSVPKGVHIATSLDNAIEVLGQPPICDSVEEIYVIGGSSIYQMAYESPYCHRLYITRVLADFKCDTFLPKYDSSEYKQVIDPLINQEEQEENGIQYKFEVYEKIFGNGGVSFNIMCAMLDPSRGIGKNGTIAWPSIKKDYQYYIETTSKTADPAKKNAIIKGRITWDETTEDEKCNSKIINIVISNSMRNIPEYCHCIARTFKEALDIVSKMDIVENIWVMGGQTVYEEALQMPQCKRIHLTRIFADHIADCFLPEFETDFVLITPGSKLQEENDVKFQFEIYQRKSV